jgi:HSP20 family molecular chaperone IbpA
MFDEMDEIFFYLVSRMQENFTTINPQVSGFRIVLDSGNRYMPVQDIPEIPSRTAASPATEVHRLDDEVKVIAELPGAAKESIRLEVRDRRLCIGAEGVGIPYHTTADLPPVDTGTMAYTFRNGVLEVTFRVLPDIPAPE